MSDLEDRKRQRAMYFLDTPSIGAIYRVDEVWYCFWVNILQLGCPFQHQVVLNMLKCIGIRCVLGVYDDFWNINCYILL